MEENTNVTAEIEATEAEPIEVVESETAEPEYLKITQEDFDKAITDRINRVMRQQKKAEEKAVREAQEAERLKNQNKAKMDADRLSELERRIADFEQKEARVNMTSTARGILKESYNLSVSDTLLSHLVADTADDTQSNIEEFATLFDAAVKSAVNERMKGKTPTVTSEKPVSSITAEEIDNIKDPVKRQKMMAEHWDLFV